MFDTDATDGSPRGSRPTLLPGVLLAMALLVPLAAPAAGHAGATQITVEASEDCPDRTYCFEVTEGSVEEIKAGEEINITLVNPSSNSLEHNLQIGELSDANQDRGTDASAAQASTRTLSPGEQASVEYFVPQGSSGLYLWCDVGVHESQGMYLEVPLGDQASTDSSGETNNSPAIGALALLAVAGAALTLRRAR